MSITELQHIINGDKVTGQDNTLFTIDDPATGHVIRQIRGANASDVQLAIAAAKESLSHWASVPPAKRAQIFFDYRQTILDNQEELTHLIASEHGKTLADAHGELQRGLEIVEYCTGIHNHLKSDFSADVSRGVDSYNMRLPLGVCAGITPFNFPAMVPMWMFPIAIACGNAFVLKVSEKTPTCGLRLTELLHQAGLPKGVLNTVVGGKTVVDELLTHPDVSAISFVGSTPVGEYIYQKGCQHNKRVQALCGAKNHLLVMPDADLNQTCDAIMGAAYGSAGERCMAISVVVTTDDETAEQLIQSLKPRIANLKIGAFNQPNVEMGPLVTQQSKEKVLNYIEQGIAAGAELAVDGRNHIPDKGHFVGGCLFDHVQPDMTIYQEEIFGPVLSVVRAKNYESALALINQHEFGNGAAIFTRDGDAARHFTQHVEAGMVGVNVPIPVPVAVHSFGGWKRSLFGNSAIHGMEGIRFYTRLKTVTSRWPSGIREGAQFHFQSGKEV